MRRICSSLARSALSLLWRSIAAPSTFARPWRNVMPPCVMRPSRLDVSTARTPKGSPSPAMATLTARRTPWRARSLGVDALLYPTADRAVADAAIHDVLQKVGLRHLGSRLDEDDQWASILSGGEQQRLAFARLLLNPPDIVIMDEATAALDEVSQARMLEFIRSDL